MDDINVLQALWDQQPRIAAPENSSEIARTAEKKIRAITKNHIWTTGMLSCLIILLLYLFFTYISHQNFGRIKGLALMAAVMIIRVLLELVSLFRFKKIRATDNFKEYATKLEAYYKFRKWMHLIITPVIYLLYILGFISLLPVFKQNFSPGFYLYLLISGFGFLFFFSFLLYRVLKKDLSNLNYLKKIELNA